MLIGNLLDNPIMLLVWIVAIMVVLTIHEFSHALAATYLGDPTAKSQGRLTLNPLSHVSWLGFFMLLLIGFGWGNPVPFNPYNLKYPKWGPAMVAAAGPLSNLLMAILSAIALKLIMAFALLPESNLLFQFLNLMIMLNIVLMIFNLLPLPPLDGSKILFTFLDDYKYADIKQTLETQGSTFLLLLIVADSFLNLNILGGIFNKAVQAFYWIFF